MQNVDITTTQNLHIMPKPWKALHQVRTVHEDLHQLTECLSLVAIGWKVTNTFGKTSTSCISSCLNKCEHTAFHHTYNTGINLLDI